MAEEIREHHTREGVIDWQAVADYVKVHLIRDPVVLVPCAGVRTRPSGTYFYVCTHTDHPGYDLDGFTAHEFGHIFSNHFIDEGLTHQEQDDEADVFVRLLLGRETIPNINSIEYRMLRLSREELDEFERDHDGFIQGRIDKALDNYFWRMGK